MAYKIILFGLTGFGIYDCRFTIWKDCFVKRIAFFEVMCLLKSGFGGSIWGGSRNFACG